MEFKDHRRHVAHLQDTDKVAEPAKPLLEQVAVESETGHPLLDKLLRAVQAKLEVTDKHATEVALKCVGCVQEDMIRLQQFEYMYNKGKVDAYKEVSLIPAQIILESMSNTPEARC